MSLWGAHRGCSARGLRKHPPAVLPPVAELGLRHVPHGLGSPARSLLPPTGTFVQGPHTQGDNRPTAPRGRWAGRWPGALSPASHPEGRGPQNLGSLLRARLGVWGVPGAAPTSTRFSSGPHQAPFLTRGASRTPPALPGRWLCSAHTRLQLLRTVSEAPAFSLSGERLPQLQRNTGETASARRVPQPQTSTRQSIRQGNSHAAAPRLPVRGAGTEGASLCVPHHRLPARGALSRPCVFPPGTLSVGFSFP